MPEQGPPAFLIATGGTAGHVLPALAIAQELRERGARVTFAGSPDRAEARLVPEAGFELDTFRISGLPRKPGPAPARGGGWGPVAAAALGPSPSRPPPPAGVRRGRAL